MMMIQPTPTLQGQHAVHLKNFTSKLFYFCFLEPRNKHISEPKSSPMLNCQSPCMPVSIGYILNVYQNSKFGVLAHPLPPFSWSLSSHISHIHIPLSLSMELPVKAPRSGGRKVSYRIETRNLCYAFQSQFDELNWLWLYCGKTPKQASRFILRDVNCEAKPGEITAIAGPSGAGKTTLLDILAGTISPGKVSGQVLVNGRPMDGESFRRISGYVTQEDALFPLLTVEETLIYSALLRLPGGMNLKEAAKRARVLMQELGLDQVAGSRIGEEGSNGGISGGERRRVSIGVELVHEPDVVLIDEPTSGLDSASALHVVSLLKSMAVHQVKTIVLTIHQPGFRILELLDRLVLLSNGLVLHNGSLKLLEERLKFAGHSLPPHINMLEFVIDVTGSLIIQTSETLNNQFLLENNEEDHRIEDKHVSYKNSPLEEVLVLGQRFCKNVFRTKQLFATRIIQATVAG